jgi:hypothetical protein
MAYFKACCLHGQIHHVGKHSFPVRCDADVALALLQWRVQEAEQEMWTQRVKTGIWEAGGRGCYACK